MKSLHCLIIILFSSFLPLHSLYAFESEIKTIADKMSAKIKEQNKKAVAVADFTDNNGNVTELGRFLAEEFSLALVNSTGAYGVIDRIHLKAIMKELKLPEKGFIDPANSKKIGQGVGADAIVTGSLTPIGERVRINVKLLDITTAYLIDRQAGYIPKTDTIAQLLAKVQSVNIASVSNTKTMQAALKLPQTLKGSASSSAGNFKFDLRNCTRDSTKNVSCHFYVTNTDDDSQLVIYKQSRFFDLDGDEFSASTIKIGNSETQRHNPSMKKLLVKDVPVKVKLTFDKVSESAQAIRVIDIQLHNAKIQFRDINIES